MIVDKIANLPKVLKGAVYSIPVVLMGAGASMADETDKYTISGTVNTDEGGTVFARNSSGHFNIGQIMADGTFTVDMPAEKPTSVKETSWGVMKSLYMDDKTPEQSAALQAILAEADEVVKDFTSRGVSIPDTLEVIANGLMPVEIPIDNTSNADINGYNVRSVPLVINGVNMMDTDPVTGETNYDLLEQAWRINDGLMSVPAPYLETNGQGMLNPMLVHFHEDATASEIATLKAGLGDLDNILNQSMPSGSIEEAYVSVANELGMNPFSGTVPGWPDMIRQTASEGAAHVKFVPGSDWSISFASGNPVITYDTADVADKTALRREWERANGFADNGRGPLTPDADPADALDDTILPTAVYVERELGDASHDLVYIGRNN